MEKNIIDTQKSIALSESKLKKTMKAIQSIIFFKRDMLESIRNKSSKMFGEHDKNISDLYSWSLTIDEYVQGLIRKRFDLCTMCTCIYKDIVRS